MPLFVDGDPYPGPLQSRVLNIFDTAAKLNFYYKSFWNESLI